MVILNRLRPALRLTAVCSFLVIQVACASSQRLAAVPENAYADAVVPGMEDVRYFIDVDTRPFLEHGFRSLERERALRVEAGEPAALPPAAFLAISGGGDNGAFGAGLLSGWSEAGDRPVFKAVTGISTGALIAAYAFLGAAYDDQLREFYTTISPDDILGARPLLHILGGESVADSAPLRDLVRSHVDAAMLEAIGEEYDKGRLLLIATTNLDAQRPVIWNIGEIARSGHPGALALFHDVLVASAAVPGAFPPVMIDVTANGQAYQEMHVDGGTISQVFIYPPSINVGETSVALGVERERILYVIRNARLDPEWASVERWILDISGRAITTMIQRQGIGDLYQIYLTAGRDDIDFNLAYIPSTFDEAHPEEFDTAYMNALFDLGFAMASGGYPWEKYPPGYDPGD